MNYESPPKKNKIDTMSNKQVAMHDIVERKTCDLKKSQVKDNRLCHGWSLNSMCHMS